MFYENISRSNQNLEMMVFVEGGTQNNNVRKPGLQGGKDENPHTTPSPGLEIESRHWWVMSAVTKNHSSKGLK